MGELYNVKYHTMHLIPKYRHEYIKLRLKWLIELIGLNRTDWPLNCTELLTKMKSIKSIHFEYNFSDMLDKYDVITEYISKHDLYLMLFNRNKVNYPFQYSRDRRFSSTIAHELSHIALGHLQIPRAAKTGEERAMEEIEADEFAGRLLMPEKLLFSCNYYSLDSTASYFNVSKTALWKRLNNIKQLDLLHSRRVHACSICGTYIFNYCTEFLRMDGDCTCSNPGNSRYCEMCGHETYFYKRGLLCSWDEELRQCQRV